MALFFIHAISSCALVALVLAAAFEEDVPLERVLARERPPALADVRLRVAVHVLVPLEVVVALERGVADAADVRARRVRAGRRGRRGGGGGARRAAVGAVQVCGRSVVRVAGAGAWAGARDAGGYAGWYLRLGRVWVGRRRDRGRHGGVVGGGRAQVGCQRVLVLVLVLVLAAEVHVTKGGEKGLACGVVMSRGRERIFSECPRPRRVLGVVHAGGYRGRGRVRRGHRHRRRCKQCLVRL